ncbi:unnamed protein product, partial [Ectocarpus sp. 12 AP-2014]
SDQKSHPKAHYDMHYLCVDLKCLWVYSCEYPVFPARQSIQSCVSFSVCICKALTCMSSDPKARMKQNHKKITEQASRNTAAWTLVTARRDSLLCPPHEPTKSPSASSSNNPPRRFQRSPYSLDRHFRERQQWSNTSLGALKAWSHAVAINGPLPEEQTNRGGGADRGHARQ